MSMDKAIESGQEKRSKHSRKRRHCYTKGCEICKRNREHKTNKRKLTADDKLKE